MEVDQIAQPIFTHKLNDSELAMVNEYVEQFNLEYTQRAELMLKRLDVTVEAFFWSERIKKLEDEIMKFYKDRREKLEIPEPVTLDDLKQASTDLLQVETTSSRKVRHYTSNEITHLTIKERPDDRGGRTAEMMAPPPEVRWQRGGGGSGGGGGGGGAHGHGRGSSGGRGYQGGRGGGGGNRGGFFQQFRNQRENLAENQVRQQIREEDQRQFNNPKNTRGRGKF